MLMGAVDRFDRSIVSGWVVDLFDKDRTVLIQLLADGEVVAVAEPAFLRPDVDAEYADMPIGFEIDIPEDVDVSSTLTLAIEDDEFDFDGQMVAPMADQLGSSPHLRNQVFKYPNELYRSENSRIINFSNLMERVHSAFSRGQHVFVIPPFIDWNVPLFQRPQHIAAEMAARGALVVYFSGSKVYDKGDETIEIRDNLIVCKQTAFFNEFVQKAPPCFIDVYSTAYDYNATILKRWRCLGHYLVYEYVDHIDAAISGADGASAAQKTFEALSADNCDIVVPTARILHEEVRQRFPSDFIALAPNGVEIERFTTIKDSHPEIDRIRAEHGGKPIVGYVGALADWLDYDAIASLARAREDLTFVMVGPVYNPEIRLPAADNLVWPGAFPYPEVPRLLNAFDIAWIPFKEGNIAKTTSPLKLFEYFAANLPVVVNADMQECVAYKEVFGASNVQEYSAAIDAALKKKGDASYRKRLQKHAQDASWKERAGVMLERFEPAVTRRLAHVMRSPIPLRYFEAGVVRDETDGAKGSDFAMARTAMGLEVIYKPRPAEVGDYKYISLDVADLGLPADNSWTLILQIHSSVAPPRNVFMVDVMVDGKLCCSFDAEKLKYSIDVRVSGAFAAGKNVRVCIRATRFDARKYWNTVGLVLTDAAVVQGTMHENVIVSAANSIYA
ncbi:MAG: glycosyltransferase [Rhodobacterales bacterium]|nr:glycosyltransferase [Rhodobacterales bacterium]